MAQDVSAYVTDIAKRYQKGNATEHTYRDTLTALSKALLAQSFALTNEPKRQACGAPDYILEKDVIPVGFIEAKDIGISLDKTESGEQMGRYLKSLDNLILTDYLEFRFFRKGVKVSTVAIGKVVKGKVVFQPDQEAAFRSNYLEFSTYQTQTIKSSKQLAEMMANKAILVKDVFSKILADEDERSTLHDQYDAFKQVLIHDVTKDEFADIYAETLAYGLFTARLHDLTPDTFSRGEAYQLIPRSNPFLRDLFSLLGTKLDDRADWIVDALCDVFRATDLAAMLKTFNRGTGRSDPFLHFYETFLGKYNPSKKKSRGVWYTPEPVVHFIVRAVDEVLKTHFKLGDGLADTSTTTIKVEVQGGGKRTKNAKKSTVKVDKVVPRVQILDVATGTGTFLAEVIAQIHAKYKAQQGLWSSYVEEHLIPRIHGFELLMASYAMCHMKLELLLQETGYKPKNAKTPPRLNVYLTNSLQKPDEEMDKLPLIEWFTRESNEASYIKKNTPIMVAIGNPPYSGVSSNMGDNLIVDIEDYKYVDGVHFGEKKHWLHDDYVKFIRLGEYFVEKNNEGILGYITNHSYLDNPTFRGMRWHLLNTFDTIYVLDLHGNANKSEKAPGGGPDKNVFDIRQGVSIIIGVRSKGKAKKSLAAVHHFDSWGTREEKYDYLNKNTLKSVKWAKLAPQKPYYFFIPKDMAGNDEYLTGFAIDELFTLNITGIVTMGDGFIVDENKAVLTKRVKDFMTTNLSEKDLKDKYGLGKNYAKWILETRPNLKIEVANFVPIDYRPFDTRYTYFDGKLVWRLREKVMRNMVDGDNLGLVVPKQATGTAGGIVTRNIVAHKTYDAYNINNLFPLYLIEKKGLFASKTPNLAPAVWAKIKKKAGKAADTPEAILDYVYAVLHAPTYRTTYAEFLKSDFPRIPYPKSPVHFAKMAALGTKLRNLHLMDDPDSSPKGSLASYPIDGTDTVDKVSFAAGRVWINATQYFAHVPKEAWECQIGGFYPAQKWLSDRKGNQLSHDQIKHYQKIIATLVATIHTMKLVDKAYA